MEWTITLVAIGVFACLTLYASWKSSRPRKDHANAQWVSWPLVTVFAGAILLLAVVHAINLMGLHTGRDVPGIPRQS